MNMLKFLTKQIIIIVLGLFAITVLMAFSDIMKDAMWPSVKINDTIIYTERASSITEQERGLGGRDVLPENNGMLFVYDEPEIRSFWMKDMLFPIDIIWIDGDKKITGVTKNITPDTFPQKFSSKVPVQYVLEVNAGFSDDNNIKAGDAVDI